MPPGHVRVHERHVEPVTEGDVSSLDGARDHFSTATLSPVRAPSSTWSVGQTAKDWASETPELSADISALRLSSIKLRSGQPVLVDFEGPDVDVYWSCEYADGKFSGLDFDS